MWIAWVAHPVLNKFCLVADRAQEVAEQKAADQMRGWDAELSTAISELRSGKASKALKQLMSPEHRRRQLAEQLTAQVQQELAALDSFLRYGVLVQYSIKPKSKDLSAYPGVPPRPYDPQRAPVGPARESYVPHVGFLSGLIPSVRRRHVAEAEERFRAACTEWERSKSEIEARNREGREKYERDLADWEAKRKEWPEDQARRNAAIDAKEAAYRCCEPPAVAEYCCALLNVSPYPSIVASKPEIALGGLYSDGVSASEYPDAFPRTFELDYIGETRTVVVDYALPPREALPTVKGYKYVASRDEIQPLPVAQGWFNETYDSVLYQVTLRTIYELFRWDEAGALDSVVFNGWVNSIDKATGREANACVLTIQASKKELLEINLAQVDPKACFRKLKGVSAANLAGLSPVRPILEISREDKRFIASRPVVDAIDSSTNLAAMDWEDFEQLIRDVFEKEFSPDGGEVKITRASRDHGVDAVAFDPDPIRGGKIVIQAKRYTDTVSVSAVRDLYGTILNEGANKGILVTTADYGPDTYEFAKGKPITLLNGSELLYLLQKHGHSARIDLAEARLLAAERQKTEGKRPSG
jgi:restriction system protein